ncbi:MAG TPA: ABC transporter permease [Candidatus Krumholzibacteria bacterium]|nr:ABC transporter permease [Candidatus Krumholzibacteria bacterium]
MYSANGVPHRRWIIRLVFFGGLLVAWELVGRSGLWPEYLFPPFSKVLAAIGHGFSDKSYPIGIGSSLWRLVEGYLIALVIGLFVGMAMAEVQWLKDTVGLLVMGLQALPSICWLPLAILWFGLNERAILFVVVMGAVMSIAQSTEDGIRNTSTVYIKAARNLGAKGLRIYSAVIFPAALPSIVTGMKMGWAFAWRSLMAGELLYTLPGLGHLLNMGRELNDMSQVLAVIIVIVTIGLITDKLVFGAVEKRVRARWGLR